MPPHDHATDAGHSAVLTSQHRNRVPAPHGRDAVATCSTEAAAARICTRVSGQWSRAGGGVRA
eukprot:4889067-Prymnesium_polylepis.1